MVLVATYALNAISGLGRDTEFTLGCVVGHMTLHRPQLSETDQNRFDQLFKMAEVQRYYWPVFVSR